MNYLTFNDDGFPVILSGGDIPNAALDLSSEDLEQVKDAMRRGATISAAAEGWAVVEPEPLPPAEPDPKLVGVEFEGVMCSATEADQNGLASVLVAIQFQGADFQPTRFFFANGNTLVLSLTNYQAFAATWLPFRQSFFQP